MQTETAMGAALNKAGVRLTEAEKLEIAATDALRRADGDRARACSALARKVEVNRAWVYVLVERYYCDLLGENVEKLPGEGQVLCASDGQFAPAPARQTFEGGDGHKKLDVHRANARPPSPQADRTGHVSDETRTGIARPVAPQGPTAAQRMANLSTRATTAVTVLDTYKLSNGMVVGKLRLGQLESLRTHSIRDAMLLRQIQKHAVGPPEMEVKDALKLEVFQRMIQKAAELADAA